MTVGLAVRLSGRLLPKAAPPPCPIGDFIPSPRGYYPQNRK